MRSCLRTTTSLAGLFLFLTYISASLLHADPIVADISAVKPGPIEVSATTTDLTVRWTDASKQQWSAVFALDNKLPLITAIAVGSRIVVEKATPVYRCSTGTRTGGWDAFFDFPPARPQGTRNFVQSFHPTTATVRTIGDRVEVSFNGMEMGIFAGTMHYTFYPGSSLIQQIAVLETKEANVAYTYDAGLQMVSESDRRPGINMASTIVYYDADSKLRSIASPYGSERHTLQVHYRTVSAKMGAGSIVALPSPHRYLFARDYTTNMGYAWYSSWRGKVGLGIQQPLDDNTTIYPWINAPAGTPQEMGIFFLLGSGSAEETLDHALAYTHKDIFPHVDGYITFAPHWHFAFTEQAVSNGSKWIPPFKPELQSIGVDAAMIMDFHIDGHPADLTGLRLRELDDYYKACRQQSDKKFLLIPAEEADVLLGGHWSLTFPKPVYWMMDKKAGEAFATPDPKFGTVYRVHTPEEMWQLVKAEHGYAYQTHPRTKGSTGYPDKILNTSYFRDPQYFATGWKAMPSDLSSPRLGERAFRTVDDVNNLGLHKVMLGEVDLFQIASTDELYGHMNVNYVRLNALPDFDHYKSLLDAVVRGDSFISTGEILMPRSEIHSGGEDVIAVEIETSSTFPLRIAEVVWGDGKTTHTEQFDLDTTHEFEQHSFRWSVKASNWKWARVAVWDIAGGGAFSNPTWRKGEK
ncbi:MAG: hypothetical protein JWM43_3914 [Acidobacteriaceae bacterium]|nr:hypothetical protein [Acidobacteriaceae bacterium]